MSLCLVPPISAAGCRLAGRLTQMARVLPLQGRCHRFESCIAHYPKALKALQLSTKINGTPSLVVLTCRLFSGDQFTPRSTLALLSAGSAELLRHMRLSLTPRTATLAVGPPCLSKDRRILTARTYSLPSSVRTKKRVPETFSLAPIYRSQYTAARESRQA